MKNFKEVLYMLTEEKNKSSRRKIERMWVNQPSTLQPCHKLHGVNVLADLSDDNDVTIYFLKGSIISQQIDKKALAKGWKGESE